jgi:hypothetical protein
VPLGVRPAPEEPDDRRRAGPRTRRTTPATRSATWTRASSRESTRAKPTILRPGCAVASSSAIAPTRVGVSTDCSSWTTLTSPCSLQWWTAQRSAGSNGSESGDAGGVSTYARARRTASVDAHSARERRPLPSAILSAAACTASTHISIVVPCRRRRLIHRRSRAASSSSRWARPGSSSSRACNRSGWSQLPDSSRALHQPSGVESLISTWASRPRPKTRVSVRWTTATSWSGPSGAHSHAATGPPHGRLRRDAFSSPSSAPSLSRSSCTRSEATPGSRCRLAWANTRVPPNSEPPTNPDSSQAMSTVGRAAGTLAPELTVAMLGPAR